MNRLHYTLTSILAAAVLAGCGASQAPASAPASATAPKPSAAASAGAAPASAAAASKPAASGPASPAASAAASAAAKPGMTKLRVGTSSLAGEVGTFLSIDRGYQQQEGIEVEIIGGISGSPNAIAAIAGNNLDVVTSGFDPPIITGVTGGVVKVVAPLATADPQDKSSSLLVRKDLIDSGKYKTPADLKGMTIEAGPVPNFSSAYTVERYLSKGNLKLTDVNLEYMGFPDALTALGSKKLDAAFEVEPFSTAAEDRGIANPVIFSGEVVPKRDLFLYLVSPSFATSGSDVLKRFFTAWLHGQRDAYSIIWKGQGSQADRDGLLKSLADHTLVKDVKTWQALFDKKRLQYLDVNGEFHLADNQEIADFYVRQGSLRDKVDTTKMFDRTFMDAAVQRLGRL